MSLSAITHWSDYVRDCEAAAAPYVIATLLGARGSTPRDSGTKMVVSLDACCGTIGGGHLEYTVQNRARQLIAEGRDSQHLEHFPLGEKLGQCCGGSTAVLLECFQPQRLPTLLFGAGHVGRALAPVLAGLPLALQWVDARADEFPDPPPPGITRLVSESPVDAITEAQPGAAYLIMTHDHPLDYALTEAALRRGDASYIGLIGSSSKWRRFKLRLQHRGMSDEQISRVHSPIGLPNVPGKLPMEIAVSVAAQLIEHYHEARGDRSRESFPGWKRLRAELETSGALKDLNVDKDT